MSPADSITGQRWRARLRAKGWPNWRIRRAARLRRLYGWTHEQIGEYRTLRQVAIDFASNTPEYRWASELFSRGARSVIVGRLVGP